MWQPLQVADSLDRLEKVHGLKTLLSRLFDEGAEALYGGPSAVKNALAGGITRDLLDVICLARFSRTARLGQRSANFVK